MTPNTAGSHGRRPPAATPSSPRFTAWLTLLPFLGLAHLTALPQSAAPGQSPPVTAPAPPSPPTGIAPDILPASVHELSLEQRRYLLYLLARLNQLRSAERLAEGILSQNPADKQVLLTLASMYVERKDAIQASRIARKLVTYYPNDHQSLYFMAAAESLSGRHAEAKSILRDVRKRQFRNQLFPYQLDLASEAMQSGDWFRAIQAYQELLRKHDLSEELRASARNVLEQLYRQHLPQLTLEGTGALIQQGAVFRTQLEYRQHVEDAHRLLTQIRNNLTEIEPTPTYKATSTSRTEAALGIESTWNQRWRTEAWAGVGDNAPLGSVKVTRRLDSRAELSLSFRENQHATDGLGLESLDGRERTADLELIQPFGHRWTFRAQAGVREVSIDQTRYGQGLTFSWSVERELWKEVPDLRISYRGTVALFHQQTQDTSLVDPILSATATATDRTAALDSLVLGELHREGLYLGFRDWIGHRLEYHLLAGTEYAFELDTQVFSVSSGVRWYPRKSIELSAEGGYLSNAKGSDLSSDQVQFLVALRYWF